MKIASFCFHTGMEQVGGAQIPAISFYEWAVLFGIDCDIVTNSKNISEHIPYEIRVIDDESELSEYDAVFFSTPDSFGGSSFDFKKVRTKTAIMTHAEFDNKYYGSEKRFTEIMTGADIQIVIGDNYWGFSDELLWYPCCSPSYLLKDFEFKSDNRDGMLYAARLSKWKNAHLLAMLSRVHSFYESCGEIIDVFGIENNPNYAKMISGIEPHWNRKSQIYNVYDFNSVSSRNSKYKYVWDVSRAHDYKFELKRFNLSAVEAMRFGCIPIAHIDSINEGTKEFTIDINDILSSPDYLSSIDIKRQQCIMAEALEKNNCYTFSSVKSQMENIFLELSC